jgi:hypothetical protein
MSILYVWILINAELDTNLYAKGIHISDAELETLDMTKDGF